MKWSKTRQGPCRRGVKDSVVEDEEDNYGDEFEVREA